MFRDWIFKNIKRIFRSAQDWAFMRFFSLLKHIFETNGPTAAFYAKGHSLAGFLASAVIFFSDTELGLHWLWAFPASIFLPSVCVGIPSFTIHCIVQALIANLSPQKFKSVAVLFMLFYFVWFFLSSVISFVLVRNLLLLI
jgi:hypothetical protein